MPILKLDDVRYAYKKGALDVLKGVNCEFVKGKLYAIIGKSGSGKSTLMSLMAGLDLPDAGSVEYEGTSTKKLDLDEYRRHRAAVIYQDFGLLPLLTVTENIMFPMQLCGVEPEKAKSDAVKLAEKVALPKTLLDRYPKRISGGEQQRVAIARALAMDRKLILADEPTGNLDSENSDMILDILIGIAHEGERCVIVVTHDIGVMQRADEIYQLTDGVLTLRKDVFAH